MMNSSSANSESLRCKLFFLICLLLRAFASQAAQAPTITSDGTLGTAVNQAGTTYNITGGSRRTGSSGSNLFHSFGLFSVGTGDTANFFNDTGLATTNILGRVTGGQVSNIFGTIKTTNFGAANLFLINPAGWVFGPTASLNVGGSFHVSTADYLKFADGAKFHADLARQSVLTSAPVSAFGFLSQNPAGISIQGSTLQVPKGQTLSLVGGNVNIFGDPLLTSFGVPKLGAPTGIIQLASVASPGEVPANVAVVNLGDFSRLDQINIISSALVDASGNGGGTVVIRAGQLVVDSSAIHADNNSRNIDGTGYGVDINIAGDVVVGNGSLITTDGFGSGRARDMRVAAASLQVSASFIGASPFAAGKGGDVNVNVGDLQVTNGGQIGTGTFGSGDSGAVRVTAAGTISLDGAIVTDTGVFSSGIFSSSQPRSAGNAGDITLEAKNVVMTGGAQIFGGTSGAGSSGVVRVTAADSISLTGASGISAGNNPGSTGAGGDVLVDAKKVTLASGAQIASNTFGSGNGGVVRVKATDTISVDGIVINATGGLPSGILSSAQLGSTGNAGEVIVEAKNVGVTGGGQIFSGSFGSGNGGAVRVTASDTITLDGGITTDVGSFPSGILSSTQFGSPGNGGDLIVAAKNVLMSDGAQIFGGTGGSGFGGTVRVTATNTIDLSSGSAITAGTQPGSTGKAGEVVVNATNVQADKAEISTSTKGTGDAGNVVVDADNVLLSGGAQISSQTFGSGKGGTVRVMASDSVVLDSGATLTATSLGSGNAGDILIQAQKFRSANSSVTTEADSADGGNIQLTVGKLVELVNSQITTSVQGGEGKGGNITIDPRFVTLNHSQITANAFGGPGGNITIVSDVFLKSQDSSVTASSALSTPGTVDIQAAITNLSGFLEPLPENIFQATSLLRQSCAARFGGGKLSSLVVGSRDGLPLEPGGFMPSLYRLAEQSDPSITQGRLGTEEASFTLASAKSKFSLNGSCTR